MSDPQQTAMHALDERGDRRLAPERLDLFLHIFRRIESARAGASPTISDCRELADSICHQLTEATGYEYAQIFVESKDPPLHFAVPPPALLVSENTSAYTPGRYRNNQMSFPIEAASPPLGQLVVRPHTDYAPHPIERALLSHIASDFAALCASALSQPPPGFTEKLQANESLLEECFEGISFGIAFLQGHDRPLAINNAFAQLLGYTKVELEKRPAMEALKLITHPDELETEMRLLHDLKKQQSHSYTIEKRFIKKDGSVLPGLATTTLFFDPSGDFRFGVSSFQDISEQRRTKAELNHAYRGAIDALVAALESRDPYTAGHQRRVRQLATAMAEAMELPRSRRMGLGVASILHDIGKIAIPAEILTKPFGVTATEYSLIRAHPVVAFDILKEISFPWPVAKIVLQHHERWDGSGYPAGLAGDDILLEARLIAVADTVEALASHRPYRPAVPIEHAIAHVLKNGGTLFDPEIGEICAKVFEDGFAFEHDPERNIQDRDLD